MRLDNPVWFALTTEHWFLARSHGHARRYPPDVSPLAALLHPTNDAFADLRRLVSLGEHVALFTASPLDVPCGWHVDRSRWIEQMICEASLEPSHVLVCTHPELRGRADADVSNLARALCVHHRHFFTFVYEKGVEPTNNRAELALRHAVQWRKISFGTRSAEGELAVARLLTVTRTCQLQQINVLAYLTAAIHCRRGGHVVASLLPKRRTPWTVTNVLWTSSVFHKGPRWERSRALMMRPSAMCNRCLPAFASNPSLANRGASRRHHRQTRTLRVGPLSATGVGSL